MEKKTEQERRRDLADAENLGNFGDNGGRCETWQRWFEREKTRGVKRQKMTWGVKERMVGGW